MILKIRIIDLGGEILTICLNERIKRIRKHLGLNQKEFAEKLSITQSGVSWMEQPNKVVSDQSIRLICTLFNANEQWLRTGEGEMYIQTDTSLFAKLAKEYNLSSDMQKFLRAILDLDEVQREKLMSFVSYFNSRMAKQ
ncbi:MAG: Cro/Cl family transcriptional regulator [Firmicutes bacterium]|nr:Cro/Cl family transcriptional regulator [Bacillota bacterium]